jgi:hypothetical protein
VLPVRAPGDTGRLARVADARDRWSTFHFSQSNPAGPRQDSVPALLRRVADSVERLGEIDVLDITFHTTPTVAGPDLTMTVYYDRPDPASS